MLPSKTPVLMNCMQLFLILAAASLFAICWHSSSFCSVFSLAVVAAHSTYTVISIIIVVCLFLLSLISDWLSNFFLHFNCVLLLAFFGMLEFTLIGKEVSAANTFAYTANAAAYKLPKQLLHASCDALFHRAAGVVLKLQKSCHVRAINIPLDYFSPSPMPSMLERVWSQQAYLWSTFVSIHWDLNWDIFYCLRVTHRSQLQNVDGNLYKWSQEEDMESIIGIHCCYRLCHLFCKTNP